MALKLKIRSRFPALVSVGSPLTLLKEGLAYTFGLDVSALRQSLDPIYAAAGTYLSSPVLVGSAVSATTDTALNITFLDLPVGDWNVAGLIDTSVGGTTDITQLIGWISTTSATLPTPPNSGSFTAFNYPAAGHIGFNDHFSVGSMRVNATVPTRVYLSFRGKFTVSTMVAYGFLSARRQDRS